MTQIKYFGSQALFIDFDVLLSKVGDTLDSDQLLLLQFISDITKSHIVLTAQWSFFFNEKLQPINKSGEVIDKAFKELYLPITGITMDLATPNLWNQRKCWQVRGIEIFEYLRFHKKIQHWCYIGHQSALDRTTYEHQVVASQLSQEAILPIILTLSERGHYEHLS